MADYKAFKSEIVNDPLARGYSSMTDQQVADDLNTAYRPHRTPIPSSELLAWSAGRSKNTDGTLQRPRVWKLKDAAGDTNLDEAVRAIADRAVKMVELRDTTNLDLGRQDRRDMLDALVNGGVLSAEDRDSLYELADYLNPQTRASEIGFGTQVTAQDVGRVR